MHTLEGIVRGISLDERINSRELSALTSWIGEHGQYADRHPFSEVLDRLNLILRERVVDEEEVADILWLCNRFSTEDQFFNQISSDMQRLQGIMAGIVADKEVSVVELQSLRVWMEEHTHLRKCWPYDELDALITSVLADGVIDGVEHEILLRFFNEFFVHVGHKAIELPRSSADSTVTGVCAATPEINFQNHVFCFTGASKHFSRQTIEEQLAGLGGVFSPRVTQKLNYLVVGAEGNPCWAFACYGRKVEAAVELRKKGIPLLIVHENDYWDAVADVL